MLWKPHCLLSLIISAIIQENSGQISKIISALDKNLGYLSKNYEKINSDCFYGIVLSGAILENTEKCPGPYLKIVHQFQTKIDEIYTKTLPILQQQRYWNNFAKYIVDRKLLRKPTKFRFGNFKKQQQPHKNLNITEGLSDYCLSSLINQTIDLKPKKCTVPEICHDFISEFTIGSGYRKTHQLLFLQIANQRNCLINSQNLNEIVHKICERIYGEIADLDKFEFFDLFLEQSILCGIEGFAEFVRNEKWLDLVLSNQKSSGCFPAGIREEPRRKRNMHEFPDGCTDHTTGLGAAILSLYLNYRIWEEFGCIH